MQGQIDKLKARRDRLSKRIENLEKGLPEFGRVKKSESAHLAALKAVIMSKYQPCEPGTAGGVFVAASVMLQELRGKVHDAYPYLTVAFLGRVLKSLGFERIAYKRKGTKETARGYRLRRSLA